MIPLSSALSLTTMAASTVPQSPALLERSSSPNALFSLQSTQSTPVYSVNSSSSTPRDTLIHLASLEYLQIDYFPNMNLKLKPDKDNGKEKTAERACNISNAKMQPPPRGPLASVNNLEIQVFLKNWPSSPNGGPQANPRRKRSFGNLLAKHVPISPPAKTVDVPAPKVDQMKEEERAFESKKYFVTRHGMKYHPYSRDDAPYMQAYNPVLLENDRLTESLLRRINLNGSPTFHEYGKRPPLAILDLGCGEGRWAVEAATYWKSYSTKVIGFDLVDLTNTWELDKTIADNVTWMQGNFVTHKLPFADCAFDLVRMANLKLCIPQRKWNSVLKEVQRILRPNGRLELIDDHIYFPYEKPSPKPTSRPPPRPFPTGSAFDSDSDLEEEDDPPTVKPTQNVSRPSAPLTLPAPSVEWDELAANSRGLESLFETMLERKFGIDPHHEHMEKLLESVFRTDCRKAQTFEVALAPQDHLSNSSSDSDVASLSSSTDGNKKDKSIFTVDWGKKTERDKDKGGRSSGESFTVTDLPETINTKAAERLGVTPTKPSSNHQSSGLIIWPSTYIAVPPDELEMHACKNIHQLIGCEAALADFIAEIKDEKGKRMMSDTEFKDALWDYECFRRKRVSWPLDQFPDEPERPSLPPSAPSSDTFTISKRRSDSSTNSDTPHYARSQLTFIRTFTWYEAYKIDQSAQK